MGWFTPNKNVGTMFKCIDLVKDNVPEIEHDLQFIRRLVHAPGQMRHWEHVDIPKDQITHLGLVIHNLEKVSRMDKYKHQKTTLISLKKHVESIFGAMNLHN